VKTPPAVTHTHSNALLTLLALQPLTELLKAVKNVVFWDVSLLRLPDTANVVPNSPILVTLTMVELRSTERWLLQKPHGAISQKAAKTSILYEKRVSYLVSTESI
jgi:hypothetical protein